MRENRPYGSEGGASNDRPYPYSGVACRSPKLRLSTLPGLSNSTSPPAKPEVCPERIISLAQSALRSERNLPQPCFTILARPGRMRGRR